MKFKKLFKFYYPACLFGRQVFLLLFFALSLNCASTQNTSAPYAENKSKTEALILDSAERFFIALKKGNFKTAWDLLSEKSHKTIIDEVYQASKKSGVNIKEEEIMYDFNSNGIIFNSYWRAFLNTDMFNTDMVLKQSRWEIGPVKENEAEILITYKASERPTRLKLFKEGSSWKVGLVETFWTRKTLNTIKDLL